MEDSKWFELEGETSISCHIVSNEQNVPEEKNNEVNSESLTSDCREKNSKMKNNIEYFHECPELEEGMAEDVSSEEHRVAMPELEEVISGIKSEAKAMFLQGISLPKIEVSPPDEGDNGRVRESVIEKLKIKMNDETENLEDIPKIQVSTPVQVDAEIMVTVNAESEDVELSVKQFEANEQEAEVQSMNLGSIFSQNIINEVRQTYEGRTHKEKINNWLLERTSSKHENKHPSDLLTLFPDTKSQNFYEIKSRLLEDFTKSTEYSDVNEISGNNTQLSKRSGSDRASSKLRSRRIELGGKGLLSEMEKDGQLFRSMSYREAGQQRSAAIHRSRSSASGTRRPKSPETAENLPHGSVINLGVGINNYSFRVRPNASPCFVKLEMPPISVIRRKTVESERVFLPTNAPGEFVPDKSVPAFEVLWLIHALLSFFGIYIFEEDESGKFSVSKAKLLMLFMHGILSVLVTVYILYFFSTKILPAWFVIYTWSYSCTQLFSLLQYIHVFRDRHKTILLLQEFQQIRVQNLTGFYIYPIFVFMYSILSLFFLFIVMPPEAYGITLALMVSLFMPGLMDMYVMSIVWIFISAYSSVHTDIINNFDWEAEETRLLSKRMKHLNSVFALFNELFSKKLLERRSLFMLQLLSYVYVLSALTNTHGPCLRLSMCTLLPCAEITFRLYSLCVSGDSLNKQYNQVHQALVEAYYFNYSLSTPGQEDAYERKKSVVYTISSRIQGTRDRTAHQYEINSRMWGSFASESSLNIIGKTRGRRTNTLTSEFELAEELREESVSDCEKVQSSSVANETFDKNEQDYISFFRNCKEDEYKTGSNIGNVIHHKSTEEVKEDWNISDHATLESTDSDFNCETSSTNQQTNKEIPKHTANFNLKNHIVHLDAEEKSIQHDVQFLKLSHTLSLGTERRNATIHSPDDCFPSNKNEFVMETTEHSAILEKGLDHPENHWNPSSNTKTDELQNPRSESEIAGKTQDSEQLSLLAKKELVDCIKTSELLMLGTTSRYSDQDIVILQQDWGLDDPNILRLSVQDSENVTERGPVFKIPQIVISEETSSNDSVNVLEDVRDCEVSDVFQCSQNTESLSLNWVPKELLSGFPLLYPHLPKPNKELSISEVSSTSKYEMTEQHQEDEHNRKEKEIGEPPQEVRSKVAFDSIMISQGNNVTGGSSSNCDDGQNWKKLKFVSEKNKGSIRCNNSGTSSSDEEENVCKKWSSDYKDGKKDIFTSNKTILIMKKTSCPEGARRKHRVDSDKKKLRTDRTGKSMTSSTKRKNTTAAGNNTKLLKRDKASTNDGLSFSGGADSDWPSRQNSTGGNTSSQSDGDDAENHLTALQLLEMLLSRLEANPINVRIWGNSRLRGPMFVFVLGAVFSYIVVLLQAVPHRSLGSNSIHGIYDNCFDNGPADVRGAFSVPRDM